MMNFPYKLSTLVRQAPDKELLWKTTLKQNLLLKLSRFFKNA